MTLLFLPITNIFASVCEQDNDNSDINITIEEEEVQEECDEWDIGDYWNITVEDVEKLRLILTPTVQYEVTQSR